MLVRWLINAGALLALPYLYSGVQVEGVAAARVAAAVLGVVNAVIRPVLLVLTVPLNLLTLGLFTFVINALMLWLAAALVDGFEVAGFIGAFVGSLLLTLISALISWVVR